MFIVLYKAHGELELEAKAYGPFNTEEDAYDYLCALPAIGYYDDELHAGMQGYKYTKELTCPSS